MAILRVMMNFVTSRITAIIEAIFIIVMLTLFAMLFITILPIYYLLFNEEE